MQKITVIDTKLIDLNSQQTDMLDRPSLPGGRVSEIMCV